MDSASAPAGPAAENGDGGEGGDGGERIHLMLPLRGGRGIVSACGATAADDVVLAGSYLLSLVTCPDCLASEAGRREAARAAEPAPYAAEATGRVYHGETVAPTLPDIDAAGRAHNAVRMDQAEAFAAPEPPVHVHAQRFDTGPRRGVIRLPTPEIPPELPDHDVEHDGPRTIEED